MFQCPGWMRKNFIPGNFSWRVVAETWDASCFKKGLLETQQSVINTSNILPLKKIFYQNRSIFQISLKYIKLFIPKTLFQGIIQEFNLGVGSHTSITLWCDLQLGGWGWGGAVCPPPILLYITNRFAYMKHLFCWQLILIVLYLTSNRKTILWLECSSSILWLLLSLLPPVWKLIALVEFENSAMMHAHSTSFPVLLS